MELGKSDSKARETLTLTDVVLRNKDAPVWLRMALCAMDIPWSNHWTEQEYRSKLQRGRNLETLIIGISMGHASSIDIDMGIDMGIHMIEGSLEVKLPTIWTDEKQRWEE
jgi:hypothetical protein